MAGGSAGAATTTGTGWTGAACGVGAGADLAGSSAALPLFCLFLLFFSFFCFFWFGAGAVGSAGNCLSSGFDSVESGLVSFSSL